MRKKEKNIYLIDSNALCYRAYYAIENLMTSKGEPTNAIYGFVNIVRKLCKDYAPERMVMVFDMPGETVRHRIYDEYKIHRKPMPDDLADQISSIKEITKAMNITICEKKGYEADDIIATLSEKAKRKGMNVVIVTSDKDALQLIDENVTVLSSTAFGDKKYTEKEVMEKYGVVPEQITEFMALTGDASDNIPGVQGIGKIGARKLITEYGNIDNIYKNIETIASEKTKNRLMQEEKMARLSRQLAVLDRDVPVDIDFEKTYCTEPDTERLTELYTRFEFKKFLNEIARSSDERGIEYAKCGGEKELEKILKTAGKDKKIFFAAFSGEEEDGIMLLSGKGIVLIPVGKIRENSALKKRIVTLFEDTGIEKIGWDIKKQMRFLKRENVPVRGKIFDVMIAGYLLDPSSGSYDIKSAILRHLGENVQDGTDAAENACIAVRLLKTLYEALKPLLNERKLDKLFEEVEMPLVNVLLDMEENGVDVDIKKLEESSKKLEKELESATKEIYKLAGGTFNINSPKQLQVVLYDQLSLPVIKKTKTGRSTDESVLIRLASMHELPGKIIDYREMNKLKTGYYDTLLDLASNNKGKIFAAFNQAVTATGRLSSSDPNLQNIPVKTALGREIRRAFIPGGKGRVIISADYSQIELRVLAHLAEDKKLIKAFKDGKDIHRVTAGKIFGRSLENVKEKERNIAKTVNFGIIYGISAFGLSKDIGISVQEAQNFIDAYFSEYKDIYSFIEKTIHETRKKGFVTTILNRRRYIPEIKSKNENIRRFAERAAVNTAVQGSAADLIKLAMIGCHENLKEKDVKMIMQIHDELVFDAKEKGLKENIDDIRLIMEKVKELKVPLVVDIGYGKNWLEAKR